MSLGFGPLGSAPLSDSGQAAPVSITGTATGTLSRITAAAPALRGVVSTGAGTLGTITAAASAKRGQTGTAAGTLTRITGAASGTQADPATAAGTVPAIAGAASGLIGYAGTGSGTLGPILGAAVGVGGLKEDEDHSTDPVPRVGSGGPKHVSGKPLGWRARRRKALENVKEATPPLVFGRAAGSLLRVSGQAIAAHGAGGQGNGQTTSILGAAQADTWDSVASDNDVMILAA